MTATVDSRLDRIGFCYLRGDGIEHFAKKYEITIGRKSKSVPLDVAIGDNMNISRQHATIVYNFDKKAWELRVLGKNGVTVKDTLYTPSSPPVTLQSGDLLQLGDRAFFFLLERGARARQKAPKRNRGHGGGVPKTNASHVGPKSGGMQPQAAPTASSLPLPQSLSGAPMPEVRVLPAAQMPSTQPYQPPLPPLLQRPDMLQAALRQPPQQQPLAGHPLAGHQSRPQRPSQQAPTAEALLPFLYKQLSAAGGTTQEAPSSLAPLPQLRPAALPPFSAGAALQQMGFQMPGGAGAARSQPQQVSPLLQQLMAASESVIAGQRPTPPPELTQAGRQPSLGHVNLPSQPPLAAPVSAVSVAGSMPLTSSVPLAGAVSGHRSGAPPFPFPEGFPAQLLQGLQQHQYLQQVAQAQEPQGQPQGAMPPKMQASLSSEQSSAGKPG